MGNVEIVSFNSLFHRLLISGNTCGEVLLPLQSSCLVLRITNESRIFGTRDRLTNPL